MITLPFEWLNDYRAHTFRLLPGLRLKNQDDAVTFVMERGFTFFWPITGYVLPSLWTAVAGDRPVADAHDDPGHITWGWKDALLGSQAWYYAKILRKKATMLAIEVAPYFYALSENYGAYEEDYLTQYEQGRLTLEAKVVYEAILDKGPLDTVALRKAAHMSSPSSETRFNRAMADLQADFKILPIAVTQAGAWHYAFAYDIVARHYPDIPKKAHEINENQARQRIAELYLYSLGAAQPVDFERLFGWNLVEVNSTVDQLVRAGEARRGLVIEGSSGEWISLAKLLDSG